MKIYSNKDFAKMSLGDIRDFVVKNRRRLIGSAVFTRNKSVISRLICYVSKGREPDAIFVPSHTGSIIGLRGEVFCFDMKPPEGKITSLVEYLSTTEDEFRLVVPDFLLNDSAFSDFISKRIGQSYGYVSALQSAFRGLRWGSSEHCSEIHLKALQAQGLFVEYDANKTTPFDLVHILTEKVVICG